MSDVKELIKQRGHIKARVTLFEKYLKPLLECKEISLVQVNELRLRLSKIRDLSCTFDDIQSQIEMLDEDTSKQMQEREFNENIFFRLSAEAQSLIDFFENKNKIESSSNKSRPDCHLKLPPIKITPFNGEANKWLSFRDTYVSLVHNNETIDDVNRFHYLKTYLEGPASAVINSQSFKIQEQSDNNSKNLPTLSPAATVATDSEVPSSSASVSMTAISTNQSLLSTALVKVTSNGKTCILRASLDCGSQSSFVTVRALRETGSQHFDSDYHSVSGIGSSVFNVTKHCYLDIGSLNSPLVMRVKCFVLPHITDRLPNVAVNVQHLDIPCHVQLADPKFFEPSDIDLLLGADVFWDLLESSRINLGPQGPILQETKLGWIVAGPTAIHSNNKNRKSFCHFSLDINQQLRKFWELEEVPSNVESHFIRTISDITRSKTPLGLKFFMIIIRLIDYKASSEYAQSPSMEMTPIFILYYQPAIYS
ncbi:unnamed protein product [Danaus chrysippus]|uniref:(African queen) hypothetical protein n=1 Tax=Danaus chrysippus TaxID=151541 RepID=A0A8J2W0T1_9NEOP|nr:unnamed protein product [Danaus chrysippus]